MTNILYVFSGSPLLYILALVLIALVASLIWKSFRTKYIFKKKRWLMLIALVGILLIGGLLAEYYFRFGEICTPNAEKNKVAIVVAKGGIYDTDRMNFQVLEYFKSVKKDLNIENAGLKKFEGKTFEELDNFVDNLYLNEDVGYIVFIGDNLPVIGEEIIEPPQGNTNGRLIHRYPSGREQIVDLEPMSILLVYQGKHTYFDRYGIKKLECIKKDCDLNKYASKYASSCRDVAASFILPPLLYSESEKLDFVLNVLVTYTKYHENSDTIIKKYQRSILWIYDTTLVDGTDNFFINIRKGYGLPVIKVSSTEIEKATDELKKKHIILSYDVHGQETILGISLLYGGHPAIVQAYYTSLEEYSKFAKENGVPALFVANPHSSYQWDLRNTEKDDLRRPEEGVKYCCWPQIFLESGVWALYDIGEGEQAFRMQGAISNEKTIGLAIRKRVIESDFILGDILAHMN